VANSIVCKIAATIKDIRYFSLMADEVTDSSNRLRWIDESFYAHEDFVKVESIGADALVAILKDVLLR